MSPPCFAKRAHICQGSSSSHELINGKDLPPSKVPSKKNKSKEGHKILISPWKATGVFSLWNGSNNETSLRTSHLLLPSIPAYPSCFPAKTLNGYLPQKAPTFSISQSCTALLKQGILCSWLPLPHLNISCSFTSIRSKAKEDRKGLFKGISQYNNLAKISSYNLPTRIEVLG